MATKCYSMHIQWVECFCRDNIDLEKNPLSTEKEALYFAGLQHHGERHCLPATSTAGRDGLTM